MSNHSLPPSFSLLKQNWLLQTEFQTGQLLLCSQLQWWMLKDGPWHLFHIVRSEVRWKKKCVCEWVCVYPVHFDCIFFIQSFSLFFAQNNISMLCFSLSFLTHANNCYYLTFIVIISDHLLLHLWLVKYSVGFVNKSGWYSL